MVKLVDNIKTNKQCHKIRTTQAMHLFSALSKKPPKPQIQNKSKQKPNKAATKHPPKMPKPKPTVQQNPQKDFTREEMVNKATAS